MRVAKSLPGRHIFAVCKRAKSLPRRNLITSVLVAKTPTTDNRIKLDSEQVTIDTKISYTLESAVKNKGKPPDAIEFSGSG